MVASSRPPSAPHLVRAILIALATVAVIIGLAVAALFNPLWVDVAQQRAGVPTITGYTLPEVRTATGSILADLFFGAGDFDVEVGGQPVLGEREREHMADVRGVVLPFAGLFVVIAVVLVAIIIANRRRPWVWTAIGWGAVALVVVALVVGAAVMLFFDTAFLVFHLVFFPQGNFMFDPQTQRLVQLFPQQFWVESATGIVLVGLVLAVTLAIVARAAARRARLS